MYVAISLIDIFHNTGEKTGGKLLALLPRIIMLRACTRAGKF